MTPLPSQILDSGVVEHGEHLQGKDIPHVLLPGSLQSNVALVPPWQRGGASSRHCHCKGSSNTLSHMSELFFFHFVGGRGRVCSILTCYTAVLSYDETMCFDRVSRADSTQPLVTDLSEDNPAEPPTCLRRRTTRTHTHARTHTRTRAAPLGRSVKHARTLGMTITLQTN